MPKKTFFFLPEQLDVLNAQDVNQLVSASAGSGKTTVMIEKIANILTNKKLNVDADQILVLTFTKAAASEMKQRLFEKLSDAVVQDSSLQPKLDGLASSNISTIHSFCQKLLTKYFYVVQIDPSFKVLDDSASLYYKSKAFDNALEQLRQTNLKDFELLAQMYGGKHSDEKLREIMLMMDGFLQSQHNSAEWINTTAKHLYTNPEKAWKQLNNYICSEVQPLLEQTKQFVEHALSHGFEKSANCFSSAVTQFAQLSPNNSLFKNAQIINLISYETISKFNDGDEEQYEKTKSFRDKVKKQTESWLVWLPLNEEAERKETQDMLEGVNALINLFLLQAKEYASIKKAKKSLDYSDLEQFTLKLLENKEVASNIRQSNKFVFVDEYQDVNAVQESMLSLLSGCSNRFMVGDAKQNIYAFRHSDPKIILEKGQQFSQSKNGVLQHLNANFRSNQAILHFVNQLMAFAMTNQTSGTNYLLNSMFNPMASFETNNNVPAVQMFIVSDEKQEKPQPCIKKVYSIHDDLSHETEQETQIEKEASVLANCILNLKSQQLYDSKQKSWRDTQFGDFTILVRDRTHMYELQEVLSQLCVPAIAISTPKLFESKYALQIMDLCKLVSNFLQDEPLVCVLLSAFGNFSEQELATIRMQSYNEKFFHNAFIAAVQNPNHPLHEKCKGFYLFIQQLKQTYQRFGITQMLNHAMKQVNYELCILQQTNGDVSQTYIVNRFANYFSTSPFMFRLDEFLDYAEKNKSELAGYVLFESNTVQVNITTIHASKGLEFPIVLLPFCGKPLCNNKNKGDLLLSSEHGMAIKHFELEEKTTKTLAPWNLILLQKNQNEFAEELRVWYVALTRAKNNLVLCGTQKQEKLLENISNPAPNKSDSLFQLILKTISREQINTLIKNSFLKVKTNQLDLECTIVSQKESLQAQTNNLVELQLTPIQRQQLQAKLNQVVSFSVPFSKHFLKNSVSSVVFNGEETFLTLQAQNETEEIVTSAKLGTAFHYIFEKLDYSKPITFESVQLEIDKAQSKQIFHRDISVLINPEKIVLCATALAPLLKDKQIMKEKKFMMKVPANTLFDSQEKSLVLVQGVVDLLAFGKQNYLFDFKLTKSKSVLSIKQRYAKQLALYKQAIESASKQIINKCFIVLIDSGELIEME